MNTDKELREKFIAWRNGPGTMAPLTEVADWWLNEFSFLSSRLIERIENGPVQFTDWEKRNFVSIIQEEIKGKG